MQLRVIIPKVQPVKLALQYSLLCSTLCYNCLLIFLPFCFFVFFFAFFCLCQRQKQRKTQWWKAERCASTAKGKRLENQGLYIRVYNFKP